MGRHPIGLGICSLGVRLVNIGLRLSLVSTFCVSALAISLAAGGVWAGQPEPISACGSGSSAKEQYLTNDLDCTGTMLSGIGLPRGGKLDLRGFSITGSATHGVFCEGSCKIFGGGTIENSQLNGVNALGRVRITNATIRGNLIRGVDGFRAVRIENSTIVENINDGVAAGKSIRVDASVISDNGCPAWNGPCEDSPLSFPDGIQANFGSARIFDSTVNDNAFGGITAKRVKTKNVIALGNMIHPTCHVTVQCGDIESKRKPKAFNTVCDRSTDLFVLPAIPWGICALD